jgi:hypothetical protein
VSFDFAQDIRKQPFTLSVSFDFAQDIRKQPFTLSREPVLRLRSGHSEQPFTLSRSKGDADFLRDHHGEREENFWFPVSIQLWTD